MKEILNKLIDKGFDAYIVGGYVRDLILGIDSYDVDICTNASIDNIIKIFGKAGKPFKEYFSYHIRDSIYEYEITTFRKELEYSNNKPIKMMGVNDLYIDLLRRDFTINTICLDVNNNIIDLLNGRKDLDNHLIRVVGNTFERFDEDKTRIVRAIRLSCTLDFDLDNEIINYINEYGNNIKYLSKEFKKDELNKIFKTNPKKFFEMKYSSFFDIKYNKIVFNTSYYGIWAQIDSDCLFTKDEKNIINIIKKIVNNKNITMYDLYKYGESICLDASLILNINIDDLIANIPIHSILDIDITNNDIRNLVDDKYVNNIIKKIEKSILNGILNNNKNDIIEFIKGEHYE